MLRDGPPLEGAGGDDVDYGRSTSVPDVPAGTEKSSAVEALIFASPVPLSTGRISEITGIEVGAVREILNSLEEFYSLRGGGILVREVGGGFGFYTSAEAAPFVARMISSQVNPRLTRAALETIAAVAYLQPVSRGVVSEIRGVQSEGVMKTLEERGLVEAVGKGGPPGYPVLYGTTTRFLERFGLKGLEDLPDLEHFAPDELTVEKIRRSLSSHIPGEGAVVGGEEEREGPEDNRERRDILPEGGGGDDPLRSGDGRGAEGDTGGQGGPWV